MIKVLSVAACTAVISLSAVQAEAGPRDDIINAFRAEAGMAADPAAGAEMYSAMYGQGKPETPGCTSCHGKTPQESGETRTGKAIDPMAVSLTPDRFTDPQKVDKWFRRNCNSVLGRECTASEKLNFLTYLSRQ